LRRDRTWIGGSSIQVLIAIAAGVLIGHYLPTPASPASSFSRWEGTLDAAKLKEATMHPVALGEKFEQQPV
jgi:hypothetical protein